MKKYIVVRDYQGGEFGMYRDLTAKEWGKKAYEWADNDGWENPNECLIENFKNEKELINFIQEIWGLKIVELDKNNQEVIEYLKTIFDIYKNDMEGKWALKLLEKLEV